MEFPGRREYERVSEDIKIQLIEAVQLRYQKARLKNLTLFHVYLDTSRKI